MRGQKRVEDARERAYDPRIHPLRKKLFRKDGWIAGSSPIGANLGSVSRARRSTKWCAADPGSFEAVAAAVLGGPGSAVHRFARAPRCTASGTRDLHLAPMRLCGDEREGNARSPTNRIFLLTTYRGRARRFASRSLRAFPEMIRRRSGAWRGDRHGGAPKGERVARGFARRDPRVTRAAHTRACRRDNDK
jgi:hypothetical protein